MIRKEFVKTVRKTAAVVMVLALAAGMYGCGKSSGSAEPAAQEETASQETAEAQGTENDQINPEQVKNEEIVKEDTAKEETAQADAAKEEAAQADAAKEETAQADAAKEEAAQADAAKEEAAAAANEEEKEVIQKPEPSEANTEAEKKKEEKKQEEEEKKASTENLNEVLDGKMTFDGMELEFPIDLSGMKLGKWTLAYELDGDPADKTLAVKEVVLAKMTSPDFTDDDVIVKAEFGNYTGSEASLTDLPMTGIYITKGKGKDGAEPKLPSLELPCGFTWGTPASDVQDKLGEASLSGSFDYDFDFMYENGEYLFEVGGMDDTGIEYIVYSVE